MEMEKEKFFTNEKLLLFLSMLLLIGCHKLPDYKMYWETNPDTFV